MRKYLLEQLFYLLHCGYLIYAIFNIVQGNIKKCIYLWYIYVKPLYKVFYFAHFALFSTSFQHIKISNQLIPKVDGYVVTPVLAKTPQPLFVENSTI